MSKTVLPIRIPETPSPTSAIPTPRSEIKVGKMGTNIPIPSCMINPDT